MAGSRQERGFLKPPVLIRWTATGVLTIVSIVGGRLAFEQVTTQPQLPDRPPISGPVVPGEAAAEAEKAENPIEARLFIQKYQNWRQSLSQEASVTLTFFPEGIQSEVISEIGVNRREDPTTQSRIIGGVRWGHSVESSEQPVRFVITIRNANDEIEEEWLGYREDKRYSSNNPQRFADMDFVAAQTKEDGSIVRVIAPQQNAISVPWPRTYQ